MHISRSCVVFAKTIELNAERFIPMDSAALFRTDLYRVPKKNLFSVFVSSFFLSGIGFYCCVPRVCIRMIRSKNCVGSSVDADQIFIFSLLFFYFDFLFVLESFIIQFSHFSLSLSLSNSFVLLSSSSNLHHPPAPRPLSSFSSLY